MLIGIFCIPYQMEAQGPKAAEAGSFEPVDATDMVNYLTGDFTYVLPLMNIPSPEGGYPIALAYHAGIAMDQEASWVGLGWNLNPGTINRSVNGFPDDYNGVRIYENFYDEGGEEEVFTLSLGYTSPKGASIGVDFSWGTNRAFGGGVSLGFGIPLGDEGTIGRIGIGTRLGTDGASINAGYTPGANGGNLSFGVSASTNGTIGGNLGVVSNGSGISISANSSGSYGLGLNSVVGKNNSLGLNFSFSGSGVGISATVRNRDKNGDVVGGAGAGINVSFANTIEQGDYVVNSSGWTIPVIVPTTAGTFSAAFGKQKVEWYLNNERSTRIFGGSNFSRTLSDIFFVRCYLLDYYGERYEHFGSSEFQDEASANAWADEMIAQNCVGVDDGVYCGCDINSTVEAQMDIFEFPIDDEIAITDLDKNNAIFPNYDNFNVEAQGISGNMTLKHYENANLFGLQNELSSFTMSYNIDGENSVLDNPAFTFETDASFYFENEFSTYLGTSAANFHVNNQTNIIDYHLSSNPNGLDRRKVSKHIEYFTNGEIYDNSNTNKYVRGYIRPRTFNDIINPTDDGIGAFTVTGSDGKNYHYSIPVYNHANVSRTTGAIKDNDENPKPEDEAYFERIQDEPYATHWLLTAITGPDYIDFNNNHQVDEMDYGYWVEFDYGRWSEVCAWKTPYGEDYIASKDDEDTQVTIHGFKDVYYLDQIKTRTHTALFIKSVRSDNVGYDWRYNSIQWGVEQDRDDFDEHFRIPSQPSLKLDNILLLKNEDVVGFSKSNGDVVGSDFGTRLVSFPHPDSQSRSYQYNRGNYVIDASDINPELLETAVKAINFDYWDNGAALARDTPNQLFSGGGRLTLNQVSFAGKGNTAVLPPYNFSYYNIHNFDIDAQNEWGYHEDMPWNWSLKEVHTPEGGKIRVTYESDDFEKPVIHTGKLFTRGLTFQFLSYPPPSPEGTPPLEAMDGEIDIIVSLDSDDPYVDPDTDMWDYFTDESPVFIDLWLSAIHNYQGNGYHRSAIDIKGVYASVEELNPSYMRLSVQASNPIANRDNVIEDHIDFVSFLEATGNGTFGGITIPHFGTNKKHSRYDRTWEDDGDGYGYSLQFRVIGNKPAEQDRNGTIDDITNGDIRVKELVTTDGIEEYRTAYYYHQKGFDPDPSSSNYKSSGTVPYIPDEDNNPIPYSLELPAPKVMYEYVTVQEYDTQNTAQGKSVYHFNVMKEKDPGAIKFGDFFEIEIDQDLPEFHNTFADVDVDILKLTVHDNLATIGQLMDLEIYNKEGQLLSRSENEYFGLNEHPNNQGIDQQSFQTYKEIVYDQNVQKRDKWLVNSSTRRNYAQALRKSTTTSGGQTIATYYDTYDGITGGTMETTSITSTGPDC